MQLTAPSQAIKPWAAVLIMLPEKNKIKKKNQQPQMLPNSFSDAADASQIGQLLAFDCHGSSALKHTLPLPTKRSQQFPAHGSAGTLSWSEEEM